MVLSSRSCGGVTLRRLVRFSASFLPLQLGPTLLIIRLGGLAFFVRESLSNRSGHIDQQRKRVPYLMRYTIDENVVGAAPSWDSEYMT